MILILALGLALVLGRILGCILGRVLSLGLILGLILRRGSRLGLIDRCTAICLHALKIHRTLDFMATRIAILALWGRIDRTGIRRSRTGVVRRQGRMGRAQVACG